jgi:hypothetical protein
VFIYLYNSLLNSQNDRRPRPLKRSQQERRRRRKRSRHQRRQRRPHLRLLLQLNQEPTLIRSSHLAARKIVILILRARSALLPQARRLLQKRRKKKRRPLLLLLRRISSTLAMASGIFKMTTMMMPVTVGLQPTGIFLNQPLSQQTKKMTTTVGELLEHLLLLPRHAQKTRRSAKTR